MDWQHEIFHSVIWLGTAFAVSLTGMTAGIALLGTFTVTWNCTREAHC